MQNIGFPGRHGLENLGLKNLKTIYWNLVPAELIEQALARHEGVLAATGALVVNTGKHTGRSPGDKFLVDDSILQTEDIWWGKINQPISSDHFTLMFQKMKAYLQGRDIFVQDMQVGANPDYRLSVRIVTEKAWASLFANNLFRRITQKEAASFQPDYTMIHCPDFHSDPEEDGTNSSAVIAFDFSQKLILVGGTSYAGEVKKAVFTVMNYILPHRHVLPMHCSANVDMHGDVALFFGLSGTGKTTLSSDPERNLIGDDEHGWGETGVFNFEGGCYAKTIRLSYKLEPLIWNAVNQFGSVLENVIYDPETRQLDFGDDRLTENTRGAYPLDFIPNHSPDGHAGHPTNIFFLMADAFGVMPPIARLTQPQAMYYFLSGYTSKLAGTEKGLGREPQATFSACFGAPFLPLRPNVYAELLVDFINRHQVTVWLINTGWTGGPYGVGNRINLPYTRAFVRAALTRQLDNVQFTRHEHTGLFIPERCPGAPADLLNPIRTWTEPDAYLKYTRLLIGKFQENFKQFSDFVAPEVEQSGPVISQA